MFATKKNPLIISIVLLGSPFVNASEPASDRAHIEEIVITARSRLPANLESFPGSVTVVDEEVLNSLRKVSSDLSLILGQSVPGLGAGSSGTASNFEQSLRGRNPAILIDGMPVGTPLRDGRHDVRSLSASVVESIEVIRGSTALYGNGGAGGVINYITKTADADRTNTRIELGSTMSTTHTGDSLAPYVDLSALGKLGGIEFNAAAFREETGAQFDASGDRISPDPNGQGGMADSTILNLFLKVGYSWGNHRVEGSILKYKHEPDSDYNGITLGDADAGIKTTPFRQELDERAIPSSNENQLINLIYTNTDVFGGFFKAQAFSQEYENIFSFSDFFPLDGQSAIFAEKDGVRLDFNTPLSFIEGASILWGVDYIEDRTRQDVLNKGLDSQSVRVWAPEVTQESFALFAQASIPITERILLQGGFRDERIDVSFPGFTALFSGVDVSEGETDYDATTYNFGLSYEFNDFLSLYAAYSEGFSTAEVGRVLRQADENTNFASAEIEASIVENQEIGAHFNFDGFYADIVLYKAESNLGTSITSDLMISRSPEETQGFEISFGGDIDENTSFGGSYTHVVGERDSNGDGRPDRELGSNRTPPDKMTAWIDYAFSNRLYGRIQVLRSASRDEFEEITAFAEAPIDAYTIVDISTSYTINDNNQISLGVHNLFNEDYFTLGSQYFFSDDKYSKGPGRVAKLSYTFNF